MRRALIRLPKLLKPTTSHQESPKSTSVPVLPESVKNAFANCSNLETVSIEPNASVPAAFSARASEPANTTVLAENCFGGCGKLKDVTLGEGVEKIEDKAFGDCDNLTDIVIPASVEEVNGYPFEGANLENIAYVDKNVNPDVFKQTVITDSSSNSSTIVSIVYVDTNVDDNGFNKLENEESISSTEATDAALVDIADALGLPVPAPVNTAEKITASESSDEAIIDSGVCGEKVKWRLFESGNLEIYGTGEMSNYNQNNPAPWTKYSAVITSASVGEGITYLGDGTFAQLTNLVETALPTTLRIIGKHAFMNCSKLYGIDLPLKLEKIGNQAFLNCASLDKIVIRMRVAEIGNNVFNGCSSLANVTINSKDLKTWGYSSFANCTGLISVKLSEGVHSIPNGTFNNCSALLYVDMAKSITSIGEDAFQNCVSLPVIDLYEGLVEIGNKAFRNSGLTSVVIPTTVTKLGQHAFERCAKLESAEFKGKLVKDTVNRYGEACFAGCTALTSFKLVEGVQVIPPLMLAGCTALTELIVPSTITWIGADAINGAVSLKNIYFYGDFPTLQNDDSILADFSGNIYYFRHVPIQGIRCDALGFTDNPLFKQYPNITLRPTNQFPFDNIVSKGECGIGVYYALFASGHLMIYDGKTPGDKNDAAHTFNYGVAGEFDDIKPGWTFNREFIPWLEGQTKTEKTIIYGYDKNGTPLTVTHTGYTNVKSVFLRRGITRIGQNLFKDQVELTSVNIPNTLYSGIWDKAFANCISLRYISIPSTEVNGTDPFALGWYAFDNCSSILELEIPNTIKGHHPYAFRNCKSLKTLIYNCQIPEKENAWNNIFSGCDSLEEVIIGKDVKFLGKSLFEGCSSLSSVTFAEDTALKEIDEAAFKDCISLEEISIPLTVTKLGDWCFQNTGLKSICLKNKSGWPWQDTGDGLFAECYNLTSVDLGNFSTLHNNTFRNCPNLTRLVIPASVTGIGADAFNNAINLNDIYFEGDFYHPNRVLNGFDGTYHYYKGAANIDIFKSKNTAAQFKEYTRETGFNVPTAKERGEIDGLIWILYDNGLLEILGRKNNIKIGNFDEAPAPWYDYSKDITSLYIGERVTGIGSTAFKNFKSLKTVDLPNYLTTISRRAFMNCSSLETVTMRNNAVNTVGNYAFYGCTNLSKFNTSSVTTIGLSAFEGTKLAVN